MKATKDTTYVASANCPVCNSKLDVERGDLRIEYGGILGIKQIPYVLCPICKEHIVIRDEYLHLFGLVRE